MWAMVGICEMRVGSGRQCFLLGVGMKQHLQSLIVVLAFIGAGTPLARAVIVSGTGGSWPLWVTKYAELGDDGIAPFVITYALQGDARFEVGKSGPQHIYYGYGGFGPSSGTYLFEGGEGRTDAATYVALNLAPQRDNTPAASGVVSVTSLAHGRPTKPMDWRNVEDEEDTGGTIYVPEGSEDASTERGADVANDTTGAYLTAVPVVGQNGYSDFVRLKGTRGAPRATRSSWNPAYVFNSEIPITHLSIPEALPGGDGEFKVYLGDSGTHAVHAGMPFVFTDHVPSGVKAFILTGFDADDSLVSGEAFPYEIGFRFASEGPNFIRHGPLWPGDYTLGGVVNEQDHDLWQARFGLSGEFQADGNNDGIVDAADYVVWRKNSDRQRELSSLTPVSQAPEPSTVTLGLVCLLVALLPKRRRQNCRCAYIPACS
jgi:hypothetical protein